MSALTIFYEGRPVGESLDWEQRGYVLVMNRCPLDLLEGMVVEVAMEVGGPRTGALVERHGPDGTQVRLEEALAF